LKNVLITFSYEYILRQDIFVGKGDFYMEKILTPDERIKRAEDIYYRRKQQDISRKSAKVNVSNKKDYGMFKKMILQIFICTVIYVAFYMIQNTNYIFSADVIKKVKEILSYDIDIKHLYEQGMKYLNSFIEPQNVFETNSTNTIESNIVNEIQINETAVIENINTLEEQNIGGANIEVVEETQEPEESLSQMEQDAKYILENKVLTIPLKGTITSRFGLRNPETPTVPKNHTGIDIAANEGTVFIASMEGVVEEVSSERRFRKSF